jgi:predicted Zn-dependent peptidase
MARTIASLILAFIAVTAPAREEKPLPKELPPYGADQPLPVADIAQHTLSNGLEVWIVPRAGLPRVNLVLAVRGGLAADPAERRGGASLLADLLTEGSATRSSRELAEALQAIGGSINAAAGNDGITLFGNALASRSDTLMALFADAARNPLFPESEVALAKANAMQGLQAQEASPDFLVERAFSFAVHGNHPYARTTPTNAAIEAVTRETLRAEHRQRFRPDRALLVIAGRIDAKRALLLARRAFGDWKAAGLPLAETPAASADMTPRFVVVDRPGSVQSALRVGRAAVAATHPDYVALALANTVLGGGFTSRITQNIREDKGYTYSPGSSVRVGRAGGSLVLRAEVRNGVTAATLNELFYEINRLGTTRVGPDELGRAKRYFAGVYMFQNQLQGAVAGTLAQNWLSGLPAEFLGSFVGKVEAISAEQIEAVAAKYYAARRQSIVVVGNRAEIDAQLAQFGDFAGPQP